MLVLGLDPSLSAFGWAVYDSRAVACFGRSPQRGVLPKPDTKVFFRRYAHYRTELARLLEQVDFDRVGIEYPVFGSTQSAEMWGLFSYCNEALYGARVDVAYISNTAAKKRVRKYLDRPSGWTTQKDDMREAARTDTGGLGSWTGDQADAYWVAVTASRFWHYYDGDLTRDDLEKWERKQIQNEHTYVRGKKAGRTKKEGLMYQRNHMYFAWSEEED